VLDLHSAATKTSGKPRRQVNKELL